jgi:hypothetical protein
MALGAQLSPTQTLVTFCLWAVRQNFAVGEMAGFSAVHPVHAAGSWHFDRDGEFGKAADINKNGNTERAELLAAVERAQELGLAVIFARDGTAGPSAKHQDHLHVDVGPFSHLGAGPSVPRGGGDVVTGALQRATHAGSDQIWGAQTDAHLEAVRAASNLHGVTFPQGVELAQRAVGAAEDGVWGSRSREAHDRTTAAIQSALGRPGSGTWDTATDGAYLGARDLRRRP